MESQFLCGLRDQIKWSILLIKSPKFFDVIKKTENG